MPPHPGEVWLADLGLAAKTRPVVVVSRDGPDRLLPTGMLDFSFLIR
jgi:mRNA-degrading endonuclease toxin of MazEF toxin-antitoxin module